MRGSQFYKRYARLIVFSILHSFILIWLTFAWMERHWQFDDEVIVARINQLANFLILGSDTEKTESLKKELLLINCSYDKMLVPFEDDRGMGTKAISDRSKLVSFIKLINDAPVKPKLIVVDMYFDYRSSYDSTLSVELKKLSNSVFSTYYLDSGNIYKPFAGLNYALADYSTASGLFLKYDILFEDTIPYVPSVMYEKITGDSFNTKLGFTHSSKGYWLNSFIVDMAIRKAHLGNDVLLWNLGEAMETFSDKEIQEVLANRIIIIGDFYENDLHETLLGEQPGPLILVNTYLALLQNTPRITRFDVLLVFVLYFATTLYILRIKSYRKEILERSFNKSRIARFILKYFSYLFIFSICTLLLYILTHKHFQLLLFAFYFNFFEFGVSKYRNRNEKPLPGTEITSG